jgi:hypothetical protein
MKSSGVRSIYYAAHDVVSLMISICPTNLGHHIVPLNFFYMSYLSLSSSFYTYNQSFLPSHLPLLFSNFPPFSYYVISRDLMMSLPLLFYFSFGCGPRGNCRNFFRGWGRGGPIAEFFFGGGWIDKYFSFSAGGQPGPSGFTSWYHHRLTSIADGKGLLITDDYKII